MIRGRSGRWERVKIRSISPLGQIELGLVTTNHQDCTQSGRRRRTSTAAVFALAACVLASCSTPPPEAAPLTNHDVVALYVGQGLSEPVAQCVAGWIERFDVETSGDGLAPSVEDQLVISEATQSCTKASALVNDDTPEPEKLAFDDAPVTYGDDPDLDVLWDSCGSGDGKACDDLFDQAPIGSEYEQFGVTCGERLGLLNCAEELVPIAD